jgi:hypothetical protein
MKTRNRNRLSTQNLDSPIPYAVSDPPIPYLVTDLPIPYRVRVGIPSAELRSFIVPKLGIEGAPFPPGVQSETRLKVVA